MKNAVEILQKYYGYKSFRKGQEDIINSSLEGRDLLAIMPTGAGKSICYQVPALLMEGVTLVISPLISLMKDQVDTLLSLGIKSAYINSTLDNNEINEILYNLKNKQYKIIYIAPERLDSFDFLAALDYIKVAQIAIDEAHCVSQWGHDFRISYKKIGYFIDRFKERPIVTAFTATASMEVRKDIVKLLKLNNPRIFINGFDRENLEITIVKEGRKGRYLKEYVKKNEELSGIIYCATRKEVDKIFEELKLMGIKVGKYHAGLKAEERKVFQEDFIKDNINVMVATNAFGMGIDKPNIRYVIHNNMPQSIEGYYQEIGRAGRDGERSECILLFTPADIHLQKYLIDTGLKNEDRKVIAYKKLQDMTDLVYSAACYRRFILSYFGEEAKEDCNNCSNCLREGEEIDKTIEAQKVLSCIGRMKRPYGVNMLVDVLRGSKNSKIISFKFNELSTYGIMKECKKEELASFINTLISYGAIDVVEGTYPVLKLNYRSMKILKGEDNVILKEVKVKGGSFEITELLSILKDLRLNIAREEGIPPYLVFGDKTLREISMAYPETREEFLEISGVGQLKYEKYGEKFIEVVSKYIKENNIIKTQNTELEKTIASGDFYVESNKELYLILRKLREDFALKEKKLPYSVIAKGSLLEISGRYPVSIDQLKDISGFGAKKLDMYGKKIIEVVQQYVKDNNITIKWDKKDKRKLIIDGEGRKNNEIALSMIQEGHSIERVSEELEISISTILGYVTDYIKETGDISLKLDLHKYFNEEEEKIILASCETLGIEKIAQIKKEIPREINYEAIRAVILKKYYEIA